MNRVCIEPSKFTDLRSGEESFGWRAFDDHSQTYDSSWSKADIGDTPSAIPASASGGAIRFRN
jgi:hypothetical protein